MLIMMVMMLVGDNFVAISNDSIDDSDINSNYSIDANSINKLEYVFALCLLLNRAFQNVSLYSKFQNHLSLTFEVPRLYVQYCL